jgi:hypothetical protein
MASCANGASVKPGVDPDTLIYVDRSLWEEVTGTPSSWFDFILNAIAPSSIKVSDLCALNLDDPPLPSLSDIGAALRRDPFALLVISDYVIKKLQYVAFSLDCVCNGASSPCYSIFGRPFSSLPDATTNGSTVYDIGMKFHCIAACDVTTFAYKDIDPHATASCDFKLWDLTSSTLLWTQAHTISSTAYTEVACATVSTLVAGHDYAITFRYGAGWTALLENSGYGGTTNADFSSSSRIDNYSAGTGTPTREFSGLAIPIQPITCPATAAPTAPTEPSQPTDFVIPPTWDCATACDIMVRLQQISDRLDWLRRDVTLLQRQTTPYAFVTGTAHSGLTGHGTIAVSGITGLLVTLTSVPAGWGSTTDVPRRLIPKVGAIQFGTSSGEDDERQLHYETQLVLDPPASTTVVDYSFRPGITATITELLREP